MHPQRLTGHAIERGAERKKQRRGPRPRGRNSLTDNEEQGGGQCHVNGGSQFADVMHRGRRYRLVANERDRRDEWQCRQCASRRTHRYPGTVRAYTNRLTDERLEIRIELQLVIAMAHERPRHIRRRGTVDLRQRAAVAEEDAETDDDNREGDETFHEVLKRRTCWGSSVGAVQQRCNLRQDLLGQPPASGVGVVAIVEEELERLGNAAIEVEVGRAERFRLMFAARD